MIDQALVDEFIGKRQKLLDSVRKKEEDAKQQAREKALAKKRNNQAVEDEWLFNCSKDELLQNIQPDSDDETDTGFRMFTPNNNDVSSSHFNRPKPAERPLKVVNFIDFSECNVQDVPQDVHTAAPLIEHEEGTGNSGPMEHSSAAMPRTMVGPDDFCSQSILGQQDLIAEIQHLRQLLADAGEEKAIELAIVRDEVDERQRLISTLKQERFEVERKLQETHDKLGRVEAEVEALPQQAQSNGAAAEALQAETRQAVARQAETELLRVDFERCRAEAVNLRAALSEMVGERDEARLAADSRRQHCERESGEAQQLRLELEQQRARWQVHNVELERLHAELNQHKSQVEFQDSRAKQYRSEIGRLQAASASRQAVPTSAVNATLAELRQVSALAHEALGDVSDDAAPQLPSAGDIPEDGVVDTAAATNVMEAELQSLRFAAKAVLSLAEQVGSERRFQSERRKGQRQAPDAAATGVVAAVSAATAGVPDFAGPVRDAVSAVGGLPVSPQAATKPSSFVIAADRVSQEEASRRTAQTLREIRGYAEQQLACISKRMCMSSLCNRHDDFACTLNAQEQEAGGVLTLGVALAAS